MSADPEVPWVFTGAGLAFAGGLLAISSDWFEANWPWQLGLVLCIAGLGAVLRTFYPFKGDR